MKEKGDENGVVILAALLIFLVMYISYKKKPASLFTPLPAELDGGGVVLQ